MIIQYKGKLRMKIDFYLTFDCEDFINTQSIHALKRILELLQKHDLRAIFFLTGHMCEKLNNYPQILDFFENHEIGYHSSAHSVHPTIFEFTDVSDYEEAYKISLERETSRINPLTGRIEGEGGLLALKDVFSNKKIVAFRAPGFCWSPPHLDALEKLGIRFDFSTNLSPIPISYKRITFYPFPILEFDMLTSTLLPLGNMKWTTMARLLRKLVSYHPLIFSVHPHDFTNAEHWDHDYFIGNPERLRTARALNRRETEKTFRCFELLLRRLHSLDSKGVIEVTPDLEEGLWKSHFTNKQVMQSYRRSTLWCTRFFNYTPNFLLNHFCQYFNT